MRKSLSWIIPVFTVACLGVAVLHVEQVVRAGQTLPPETRTISLGDAEARAAYAVTIAVKDPAQVQVGDAMQVSVHGASGPAESKWLHSADLDLYLTLQPHARAGLRVGVGGDGHTRSGTDHHDDSHAGVAGRKWNEAGG